MNVELERRMAELCGKVNKLCMYRDLLRSQIASGEQSVFGLQAKAELFQQSSDVFKSWLEDSMHKNLDSMSDLVTSGLRHVVHDQRLSFKIKQELKYNRLSMKFMIKDEDADAEGDPMSSFGGGAVLTASLILRLAIMARLNMGNLLLLDESMHALANKYVPAAASFMRQLSEQTGINILMVTHNEEFLTYAHVAYEGKNEGNVLRLHRRKMTGEL